MFGMFLCQFLSHLICTGKDTMPNILVMYIHTTLITAQDTASLKDRQKTIC